MGKCGVSLSCLCWRSTRGVGEPVQRGTAKCSTQIPQCRHSDDEAVKNEAIAQNSLFDCKTLTQASCGDSKQPTTRASLESNQELDGIASNISVEVVKSIRDASGSNDLLRLASNGTQAKGDLVRQQMQQAPTFPPTVLKSLHVPYPSGTRRIASNETTTADEYKDLEGDDRSVPEEPEPRDDTVRQQSFAQTHHYATNATAALGVVGVPREVEESERSFKAENEGDAPSNEARDHGHETIPTTEQLLTQNMEQGSDFMNERVPVAEKAESGGQKLTRQHYVESRTNSFAKWTESPQQKSREESERKPVHPAQSPHRSAPYGCTQDAISILEDDGNGAQVRGAPFAEGNGPQTRARRKKKVSKTKGKRRYGKTGRR